MLPPSAEASAAAISYGGREGGQDGGQSATHTAGKDGGQEGKKTERGLQENPHERRVSFRSARAEHA